jgi:hypothetical protein
VPLSKNINNKIVENLLIINEIKHPKRGRKTTKWMDLVQDGCTRVCAKKKPPTRGTSTNQVFKPPQLKGTYKIRRGEEHLKKPHLQ